MAVHGTAVVLNNDVFFDCSWKIINDCRRSQNVKGTPFQTIDIAFEAQKRFAAPLTIERSLEDAPLLLIGGDEGLSRMASTSGGGGSAAFNFLLESLRAAMLPTNSYCSLARFIIPLAEGQIIRSDIIPLRFTDCEVIALASSFAEPLQPYSGDPISQDQFHHLDKILEASIGGLLLRDGCFTGDVQTGLRVLSCLVDAELENRLSFHWITTEPLRRLRLALVEGSRFHPDHEGNGPNIYLVAKALGIDVVVLDNSGHWLESGRYESWREAFIPTKLGGAADAELANRIVASIQSFDKQIDGIVTFWDRYQPEVAHAARRLGLPTMASPESYQVAINKYKTSIAAGHDGFQAFSAEEAVRLAQERSVEFPLIVKPCLGTSSDGVSLVNSISELSAAAASINADRHGSSFVVEKYCSGPEVDANFVLMDGEIMFFESCDDFPKTAEDPDVCNGSTPAAATFHELNSVFPSALPQTELDLIRDNFHEILSRLGFGGGVLHLEGRVDHSSVEYRREDGVLDLAPLPGVGKDATSRRSKEAVPWLIEIGARPPGMMGTQIIESTWGVDYWGLGMLIPLRDKARVRALSQPYQRGPQYTCVMVFISADYDRSFEGIFDSDDVCAELFTRRPRYGDQHFYCIFQCLFKDRAEGGARACGYSQGGGSVCISLDHYYPRTQSM